MKIKVEIIGDKEVKKEKRDSRDCKECGSKPEYHVAREGGMMWSNLYCSKCGAFVRVWDAY